MCVAGVEQQPVQERGAQGGGQRQGGALLCRLLPLPVLRLARRHVRRAIAVQELHLRGVQEDGAGGRQEDRQKDWAPQLPQATAAPVTATGGPEREHHLVPSARCTRICGPLKRLLLLLPFSFPLFALGDIDHYNEDDMRAYQRHTSINWCIVAHFVYCTVPVLLSIFHLYFHAFLSVPMITPWDHVLVNNW